MGREFGTHGKLTNWEYPCGFVLIGAALIDEVPEAKRLRRHLLSDTVMMHEFHCHTLCYDVGSLEIPWPTKIDLVTTTGPCIIKRLSIGNILTLVGMHSKFATPKFVLQRGERLQITLECRPEIFRLKRQD